MSPGPPNPPVYEVDRLAKTYPQGPRALDGVSFTINRGESVALLGRNGSGKSTLLRCLNGLERPDEGRVKFEGEDLPRRQGWNLRRCRRRIGVVFQRFNLVGNLSVFQNVLFGGLGRAGGLWAVAAPLATKRERELAWHCLERVGLADLAPRRADRLSGGQQQRVAIARMLMQEPDVVLADEPVASLDPQSGRQVMDLLWEIVHERGLTVICTLHHLELALAYGRRIIGLRGGRKVLDEPVEGRTAADLEGLYDQA